MTNNVQNTNESTTPTRRHKFKIISRSSNPVKRSDSVDSLDLINNALSATVPSSSSQRSNNGRLTGNLSRSHSQSSSLDTLSSSSSSARENSTSSNCISIPISYFPGEPNTSKDTSKSSGATAFANSSPNYQHSISSNYPHTSSEVKTSLQSQDSVDSSPPPLTPKSRAEWLERRRQRFLRSRTNPDIFGSMDASDRDKLKASTNSHTTSTALSARVQQLLSELEFKSALTGSSAIRPSQNGSSAQSTSSGSESLTGLSHNILKKSF